MMHRLVKMARRAQHSRFHLWLLNRVLWRIIPFNRPHRLEIVKISDDALEIRIPYRRANFNHIKGLHACCLATVAEYATGLLLVMQVDPTRYRLIMQAMHMEYHYQGKMDGFARFSIDQSRLEQEVFAPLASQEAVVFSPEVQIHDREGNHLVTGIIHWQIKRWDKVRTAIERG